MRRPLYWHPLIEDLRKKINSNPLYLVGGTVRDTYMGRMSHDIDLATPEDGRPVARAIANAYQGDYYPLDDARGVGRALIRFDHQTWIIDVAQFRGDTLEDDLRDRDFSMNAMAVSLEDLETLIDPLHGAVSIDQKIIRLCQSDAIVADPIRALRAVRMSIEFGMRLESSVIQAIKRDGHQITTTSAERVRDEFFNLLNTSNAAAGLKTLDILGLLALILPETQAMKGVKQSPPHTTDVWQHSINVVSIVEQVISTISPTRNDDTAASFGLGMIAYGLPQVRPFLQEHITYRFPNNRTYRALMILAALAHDSGKPATQSVDDSGRIRFFGHEDVGAGIALTWGQSLRLSNEEIKRLKNIVSYHMRPHHLFWAKKRTRRAIYRYWRDVGTTVGVDVCLLAMADMLAIWSPNIDQAQWLEYVAVIQTLLEAYYIEQEIVTFDPIVHGQFLIREFDLKPGPYIGSLLAAAHEAQAIGEITSEADAREWIKIWLEQHPLHSST